MGKNDVLKLVLKFGGEIRDLANLRLHHFERHGDMPDQLSRVE